MEAVMEKLNELIGKSATDEEYTAFLGSLTTEEWNNLFKQLAPNPFKGRMGILRQEALKNKKTA